MDWSGDTESGMGMRWVGVGGGGRWVKIRYFIVLKRKFALKHTINVTCE